MEYRGYIIKPLVAVPTSYHVATAGQGGKIPAVLDSLFTTPTIAKAAIDDYLNKKEEESNAKASRQARG